MVNKTQTIPLFILIIILSLYLVACGTSFLDEQRVTDSDSRSDIATIIDSSSNTVKFEVSEQQYQKDLISSDNVQKCFYSEFTNVASAYELQSCNIVKRDINVDAQTDDIYIDAVIDNDYFSIELSVVMEYKYYDVGGWICDNLSVSKKLISPTGNIDENAVLEAITALALDEEYENKLIIDCIHQGNQKTLRYGELTFTRKEFDASSNMITFNVNYHSPVVDVYGFYLLSFDNSTGWKLNKTNDGEPPLLQVMSYETDYSSAIGSFSNHLYKVEIKSIDKNNICYTLDGIKELLDEYGNTMLLYIDDIYQKEFDPLTGSVSITYDVISYGTTLTGQSAGMYWYNPMKDYWETDYPEVWHLRR